MSAPGERVLLRALALVALALPPLLALVGCREALASYADLVMPYLRDEPPVFFDIPPGTPAATVVDGLARAGVIRSRGAALSLLERRGETAGLKAGEYRFDRPLAVGEVLGRILRGDVFLRRITIPEGLTRFEAARRFEASGFGHAADFLAASAGVHLVADLDPRATDLEGYLFPETYSLGRNDGAERLVRDMVARFREVAGAVVAGRAAALGLSLREAVTLASLVEKETARAEERPLVAGVYLNRIRRGMLLQADPTVIYGLVLEGRYHGNLTRAHLREPGAYNTYTRAGLPPGPIASPGRAALEAALAPLPTEYLYFVSRNDGSHVFSRTLAEHNRAVAVHQRAYWRERWRRQARPAATPTPG